MDTNKNGLFELNDDELDQVSGGVGDGWPPGTVLMEYQCPHCGIRFEWPTNSPLGTNCFNCHKPYYEAYEELGKG